MVAIWWKELLVHLIMDLKHRWSVKYNIISLPSYQPLIYVFAWILFFFSFLIYTDLLFRFELFAFAEEKTFLPSIYFVVISVNYHLFVLFGAV